MFSVNFLKEALKQFIYHPYGILKLPQGLTVTNQYLTDARLRKWRKQPLKLKKLKHFTILLNLDDNTGLSAHIGTDGLFEPAETSLIQKILKPNMVFVDVGANIGWYTLLAASKIGDKGKVISFEPEPKNFNLLEQSISLNNFKNVTLFQKCLSNNDNKCRLYLASENFGAHSIVRQHSSNSYIDVEAQKLDDSLGEIGIDKIDVLMIDVEGAEALVLEGGELAISKGIKHILMEWNADAWQNKTTLFNDLFANYTIYKIVDTPFLIKKTNLEEMKKIKFSNLYLRYINRLKA